MTTHQRPDPYDGELGEHPTPLVSAVRLALVTVISGGILVAAGSVLFRAVYPDREVAGVVADALEPPPMDPLAVTDPEPGEQLLDAQAEVLSLEAMLAAKERELEEVALAAGVPAERLATTDLALEVANLRANLDGARVVRDRLKGDLEAALAAVDAEVERGVIARAETDGWKARSVRSRWEAFTATAKVELCDHGTRRGVDSCHASVDAYFTEARFDRFADCLEMGGAEPAILTAARGAPVPANAQPIGPKPILSRTASYVLYCDPTLPEMDVATSDNDQRVAGAR